MSIDHPGKRPVAHKPPLQPGKWFRRRAAGVVLHVTALPGNGGGKLGATAHRFVNFLADAGVDVWQTLPVGPVNDSLSPYQPLSLLAGNFALIDPETLVDDGLLPEDFDRQQSSRDILHEAFLTLRTAGTHTLAAHFDEFRDREHDWLADHALFLVLDRYYSKPCWTEWPAALRDRQANAIDNAHREHAAAIAFESFLQWQFDRQWRHLRHHANLAGVRLFGDLPIYPALHSADVWLEPELFLLDAKGQPTAVGGTPPDAFTATGQSWGTPMYDWNAHIANGFRWWVARLRSRLCRYDLLRIDHFRGLAACWAIPAAATSAAEGSWQPAPGKMLLTVLADELPELELVVEDLGHITEDVHELRNAFGLPGMRVLQFGFDGDVQNPHLPEQIEAWSVYYSGTHDNNTTLGWWRQLSPGEKSRVRKLLAMRTRNDMPWPLLRAVFDSRAGLAMAPLQDFLGLGEEARFNIPGTVNGNWRWQVDEKRLDAALARRIRHCVDASGRLA